MQADVILTELPPQEGARVGGPGGSAPPRTPKSVQLKS